MHCSLDLVSLTGAIAKAPASSVNGCQLIVTMFSDFIARQHKSSALLTVAWHAEGRVEGGAT